MPAIHPDQKGRSPMLQWARSRKKTLVYLAIFFGMSWAAFVLFNGSYDNLIPSEQEIMDLERTSEDTGYGSNAQPGFADMIQLVDLPSSLLPETGRHRHSGRLVIVGDVHGMKDELIKLLDKVRFDEKHDHLILAGDMISKGPDSTGVVDLAMRLGATGVRGNHEDRIILAHADMVAGHILMDEPGPSEDREKTLDVLEEESFNHGDYKDRALVRALGEKRIKWLKKCPVILRVGDLGDMREVIVVHAGLAPGVKLEKQDPIMVMNMRTISKDGVPSSDHGEGTGWTKVY